MLYQYEPSVKATIAFLKRLKVRVNNTTVNETLQNHPDWPSLFCISDCLQKWNIPNAAAKIKPTEIDALPLPFLAYTHRPEDPFVIVEDVGEETLLYYSPGHGKKITQSKNDFSKDWDGIYIIAEPNGQSGEKEYAQNKQKAFIRLLVPIGLLLLLSVTAFTGFAQTFRSYTGSLLYPWLLFIVQFTGVIITSLLLWYEMDKTNPLLQKVCTGIVRGNCSAILTTKAAKPFKWLSWSEAGLFYFAGGLIVLVSASLVPASLAMVSLFNLIALPYIIFSVYYQWQVAKQWCLLCLAVQGLLLAGGLIIFGGKLHTLIPGLTALAVIQVLLIYAIPVLSWLLLKPYLIKLQEANHTQREYLRIKFNNEIFEALLKTQKQLAAGTEGLGINLGNPNAPNTLIKVCNPYCGPCAKAHPEIEKLLEENENLKAKIIFTAPNNPEHMSYKPVAHLLAIAEEDKNQTRQALDDWYLANDKDYELFSKKHPVDTIILEKQRGAIESMHKWCRENGIQVTPTIFLNGHQMPASYTIGDLHYFLQE